MSVEQKLPHCPMSIMTEDGEVIAIITSAGGRSLKIHIPDNPTHMVREDLITTTNGPIREFTFTCREKPFDPIQTAVDILESFKKSLHFMSRLQDEGIFEDKYNTTIQELKKALKPKP